MSLGPAEIIVVLVIALLVFGPTRLPEVGRQVGRTMREFRKFQETIRTDVSSVFHDDEPVDATKAAEPPPSLPPKAAADPTSAAPAGIEAPASDPSPAERSTKKGDGA